MKKRHKGTKIARILTLCPCEASHRGQAPGTAEEWTGHITPGWQRRNQGQALVETLLALPILLLLVLGLIGLGQILLANYTVTQAARAAAHQAAIAGGGATGEAAARATAQQVIAAGVGMEPDQAQVTVTCAAPCRRYASITVTVRYQGEFWAPLPPLFTAFEVRAEAVRAAERDQ